MTREVKYKEKEMNKKYTHIAKANRMERNSKEEFSAKERSICYWILVLLLLLLRMLEGWKASLSKSINR